MVEDEEDGPFEIRTNDLLGKRKVRKSKKERINGLEDWRFYRGTTCCAKKETAIIMACNTLR